MNNEELETRLLLMKQSIEQLQEKLAPNLKTRDLMLLRYMYSYKEINMLNSYLFQLATNKEQITKKQFKTKLENIREVPEIPLSLIHI